MRKKIQITPTTKPLALYAIGKGSGDKWLILASHIKEHNSVLKIYRHLSINLTKERVYFDGNEPKCWGNIRYFDFYFASQKDIFKMKNELKKRGYKFIPILNKLEKIHGI